MVKLSSPILILELTSPRRVVFTTALSSEGYMHQPQENETYAILNDLEIQIDNLVN